MKLIPITALVACCGFCCFAQTEQLKSASYGLAMMLDDVPKERLIEEIRFDTGREDSVDVVRFDVVGHGAVKPLIVSSKIVVPTDSMGFFSFVLSRDTLTELLSYLHRANPQFHSRKKDFVLIRVTYRYQNQLNQYYVTGTRITSAFLRTIENQIISNKDEMALKKFYLFIGGTKLRKSLKGKIVWIYW